MDSWTHLNCVLALGTRLQSRQYRIREEPVSEQWEPHKVLLLDFFLTAFELCRGPKLGSFRFLAYWDLIL